ncbi:carboxylesterase family protein [uncultured Draconibacterium sp.]|uniref:carboxylesterase/lipase family protein n=1 Tax=uncultured Draconibacterium sp. TaxID=1573823 RepID=UPI002AA7896D|nr:carboxylesterase family protein [uncultured Draconibacterium sp.]
MMDRTFILLIVLLAFASCKTNQSNTQETAIDIAKVKVDGGLIPGVKNEDSDISVFKGIPFAAPPVGDLRWKAPAPVQKWEGVKKCDTFAASAMQPFPEPFYMWSEEFLIPEEPIDEDCLYLNVWTGAKSTDEKRPVVVFIHGGGFTSGSGSVPIYDGEAMAKKGVVFVNINYRLGIFGFLAHPELTAESPNKASGNYGLMDQIAALKWVKNNIAAFGGNPDNITIAGQSAGSASVVFLVASPKANGLFQKAIAQSGAGLLSRNPGADRTALLDLNHAELVGSEVADELNATSLEELRKIPSIDLQNKVRFNTHPIIDGYILPESVTKIFTENIENNVSILTGWNEDDGVFIGEFEKADEYKKNILEQWGDAGQELLRYYPATKDEVAEISQLHLQRDIAFGAQNYTLANLTSDHGKNVYVYRFTRRVPPGNYVDYGAFHTGEVAYAYNNLEFVDRPFEDTDYQLADVMSEYWVNFIIKGDPNSDELPDWPAYKTDIKEIMYLGDQQKSGVLQDTASLNFLHDQLIVE